MAKTEYSLKYCTTNTQLQRGKKVYNSLDAGNTGLAASYRMKLSSIALIVFLIVAAICFYLKLSGVINDVTYYVVLFGLIVAALVLTLVLGRISKKRYSSAP
jgi:Flp pilus assembly protein TadB